MLRRSILHKYEETQHLIEVHILNFTHYVDKGFLLSLLPKKNLYSLDFHILTFL